MLEIRLDEDTMINLGGTSIQKDFVKLISIAKEYNSLKSDEKILVLNFAIEVFTAEIKDIKGEDNA